MSEQWAGVDAMAESVENIPSAGAVMRRAGGLVKQSSPGLSREACRRAIERRDLSFEGAFVTAVWSTGIYCRLSCPARRPDLNRVSFFTSPREAEAAGYRACLRCHPKDAPPAESRAKKILAACRYIEENAGEIPRLADLAARVGLSPFHLQREFRRALGVTPRQYADALRVEGLKDRLRRGEAITPALYDAGYGSSSRLYEKAAGHLGMTPGAYQRGGKGERIGYTVVSSALGPILVAATPRGLCRVNLGRTGPQLAAGLRLEFPKAVIEEDARALRAWVKALVDYLEGERPLPEIPLAIRATAFQRRVWEALRKIPYGETRSYEDIARRIGRPKAVRAVANACAHNPVPLFVPCHRVVRKNGGLGGYGGGIARKKALLRLERDEAS